MNELPKLEFISWDEFQKMCFELSQQLSELRPDLDTIVSVARGGHVVSRVLSDFLKLPIFSVSIQSYTSIEQQGELKITQELGVDLTGRHVLLVDEVVDTGKTLVRGLEYLEGFGCHTVTSVGMHVKPKAIARPDFYIRETEKWIVYPYEIRESIEALLPLWEKHGRSKSDLVDVLVAGGMRREYVEVYVERTSDTQPT